MNSGDETLEEYEEYAKFVEANDEDWKDWETTAAHDVGKDLYDK